MLTEARTFKYSTNEWHTSNQMFFKSSEASPSQVKSCKRKLRVVDYVLRHSPLKD